MKQKKSDFISEEKDVFDIDEILKPDNILTYFAEHVIDSPKIKLILRNYKNQLVESIKLDEKKIILISKAQEYKLSKYLKYDLYDIPDQLIILDLYFLEGISKEIKMLKNIIENENKNPFTMIKIPEDINLLRLKNIELKNAIIKMNTSFYVRLYQMLITRIDKVREKIGDGSLVPFFADLEISYNKKLDKLNEVLIKKKII